VRQTGVPDSTGWAGYARIGHVILAPYLQQWAQGI
jgi:hypothetical protein